jgi:hypothetical protein
MRIRFEYPVKTALRLKELWPITVADVKMEWRMKGDEPVALIASCAMAEQDRLPTVTPINKGRVAAHIDAGHISRHDEVEKMVRTIQGLVTLFATIDIDFEECKTRWEPENEEEKSQLQLNELKYGMERHDLWKPRPLSYEFIARAMLSSDRLSDQEVTLAFLRRGRRDFHAGDYILAFYNFFFFLETQFAPGYSDPKKVEKALLEAEPIRLALATLRSEEQFPDKAAELLKLKDEDLIKHLVKMRGNLHHHAQRRQGSWHPDKSRTVEAEAEILHTLVHSIAFHKCNDAMFAEDMGAKLRGSAEADSALTTVKVIGYGVKADGTKVKLGGTNVSMPGRVIDRAKVQWVQRQIRAANRYNTKDVELVEYAICSDDEKQVFARWWRMDRPAQS